MSDLSPLRDLGLVETECPDCGSPWPGFARREPCPGCGLSVDDVEEAADFIASTLDPETL